MKKIFLILLSSIVLFFASCSEPDNAPIISSNEETSITNEMTSIIDEKITQEMTVYIDSLLDNTTSYIPAWNKESFKGKWNYIDGVFLNSIVNLYKLTKEEKYKNFFLSYIDFYINANGEFINPETKEPSFNIEELDSICESRVLFDAYELTNDSRYLNAIEYTYSILRQQTICEATPCYSHKLSYQNQIWLDGFYMYVPFLCRYAILKNDLTIFDEIASQYEYVYNHMRDTTTGLYYHGYDSTKTIFWADRTTGLSSSFWSRSMGWFAASLADAIDYYPDGSNKEKLTNILYELFDSLLQYCDNTTKMYYQLTDKDSSFSVVVPANYLKSLKNTQYAANGKYSDTKISNYLETSSSSLFAYAMMKSGNELYKAKGYETFMGVYSYSLISNNNKLSLENICITAGLGPSSKQYRDGTPAYYLAEPVGSDDAKGVGPFIMAYIESIKE